jgi:hypothetical protein
MVYRTHAARLRGFRPPRGVSGMKPLLAGENLRADQPHRPGMRINFVKNVPRLTMHWHERASLRPREVSGAFYRRAEGQPDICDDVRDSMRP